MQAMSDLSGSWRTSRTCDGGACVEVGGAAAVVAVRDSSDPDGARLAFAANTWAAFTAAVKRDIVTTKR